MLTEYEKNEDSGLLIVVKEYLNNPVNSVTNNFDYEIYTNEGEKVNISKCHRKFSIFLSACEQYLYQAKGLCKFRES